jgi:hypothetical protein
VRLFGDRHDFGLEIHAHGREDGWSFGYLQLWLGGMPLGARYQVVDLGVSARWVRTFLAASPRRTRADLDACSTAEVFHALYGRHFEEGGAQLNWDRDPHVLDEIGEAAFMDRHALVAVRRADRVDRVVIKDLQRDALMEVVVAEGICDAALTDYARWVEGLACVS